MTFGRMMDFPLTIGHLVDRAASYFGRSEIVSTLPHRSRRRDTYAEIAKRCQQLASALTTKLGVRQGDRIATLCWNHSQHLEAYLAIPAMGAILHTLNLRLNPAEIGYIANHAGDTVVIVDQSLLPLFEKFRGDIKTLRHVIVIADRGEPIPAGTHDYEELLTKASKGAYVWPSFDENTAAMLCYTSGTTGSPKGTLYSHRSTLLHALVAALPNLVGCSIDDVVLPVVPMFHAAAWGLPYIAVLCGAKLVFPGPHLDPESLVKLMESERVTLVGGVPTIWLGILAMLDASPGTYDLRSIRRMLIGGSAAPPTLIEGFERRHGLVVLHAWGMTETNPIGTVASLKPHLRGTLETELPMRATQGYAVPFFETRHVDSERNVLPRDGEGMGELEVRGPWVAASYFGDEGKDRFTDDGWFRTGDVVKIDPEGYVSITDREKDVIKSGGEWISTVSVENALMSHPAVLEAAVFAARHPKWDERPVAAIVLKPGRVATTEELTDHLRPTLVKYELPDAYVFLEQIPRTSTGKFLKAKLRELYGDILLG
jgi:fatty-acyl-CoA synthase